MENVPDTFNSLFWGYAVIWLLLSAYILALGGRLARLEKRMHSLDKDAAQ